MAAVTQKEILVSIRTQLVGQRGAFKQLQKSIEEFTNSVTRSASAVNSSITAFDKFKKQFQSLEAPTKSQTATFRALASGLADNVSNALKLNDSRAANLRNTYKTLMTAQSGVSQTAKASADSVKASGESMKTLGTKAQGARQKIVGLTEMISRLRGISQRTPEQEQLLKTLEMKQSELGAERVNKLGKAVGLSSRMMGTARNALKQTSDSTKNLGTASQGAVQKVAGLKQAIAALRDVAQRSPEQQQLLKTLEMKQAQIGAANISKLGKVTGLTAAQQNALQKTLNATDQSIKKVGKTSQKSALNLINLRDAGAALSISAMQVKQAVSELITGFFEFETVTQQVLVLDETVGLTRDNVAKAAEEIAIVMGEPATEIAESIREVVALGISFEDAVKIVTVSAKAAKAGIGSITDASELAVTISRQFGLSLDDTSKSMAKLVFVANETAFNISDMREAMAIAGPAAAGLGFTLEETAAATALLRDAGLKASKAGTAMRQFLIRLQDPTEESKELLDELGISLTDESGNFLDLVTILKNTGKAMEGLTQAEKAEAQATLFEVRGQQLLNIERLRGADDLQNLIAATEQFNDAQRAEEFLNERASVALDTLTVRYKSAQEALAATRRELAENFIPAQILWLETQNSVMSTLTNMHPIIQQTVGGIATFGAEIVGATGQTILWAANMITLTAALKGHGLAAKIASVFTGNFTMTLTKAKFAAVGLAASLGAIFFIFSALTAKTREASAAFSILGGILIVVAARSWIAALAQAAHATSLTFGVAAALIAAGVIFLASEFTRAQAQAEGAFLQFGGVIKPKPGVGRSVIIGEGVNTEIVSPVPMMKETFREVIREQGGTNNITITPTLMQSNFGTIDPSTIYEFNRQSSKEILKALRRRGVLVR